jgi:hypothetical protein
MGALPNTFSPMGAAEHVVVQSDIATTIIAAFGLAFAVISLAWQAWSFRQQGSRVRAEIRSGMRGPQGYATRAGAVPSEQLDRLREQGFTTPVIAVRVINAGRGATSVVSVDISYAGGFTFSNPGVGPNLPHRLEGEHEETWHFEGQQVTAVADALAATHLGGRTMRASVAIAGRQKPILSKNEIRPPPAA